LLSVLKSYYNNNEFKGFLLWILILIFGKYFLSEFLNQIVYTVFLVSFYFSKRNALWIAIAIITTDFPGEFLSYSNMIFLPVIRDYTFHEAFILISFFKSLKIKPNYPLLFKTGFLFLAIYILLLFIYSLGLGTSSLKVFRAIRYLFMWSLLYSLPRLLNYSQIKEFFSYIFFLMPIGLIIQLLSLYIGISLAGYLFGIDTNSVDSSFNAIRIVNGVVPAFFVMLGSLIYYKRNDFPLVLLNINIVLSFIFIASTATRGWTIGYVSAMIFFLIIIKQGVKSLFQGAFIFLIIITIVVTFFPKIGTQLTFATERLMTVESIAKGDMSANNTLGRITDYAPIMKNSFLERPILGYGLLDRFAEVSNDHLGYQNHLLVGGIIGFIFTFGFILVFLFILYKAYNLNQNNSIIGVIAGFIFILMTNSGACMITFINYSFRQFILSFLFILGSAFYYEKRPL
jgi:hypothetical protein